jgi:hypothetical protein
MYWPLINRPKGQDRTGQDTPSGLCPCLSLRGSRGQEWTCPRFVPVLSILGFNPSIRADITPRGCARIGHRAAWPPEHLIQYQSRGAPLALRYQSLTAVRVGALNEMATIWRRIRRFTPQWPDLQPSPSLTFGAGVMAGSRTGPPNSETTGSKPFPKAGRKAQGGHWGRRGADLRRRCSITGTRAHTPSKNFYAAPWKFFLKASRDGQ